MARINSFIEPKILKMYHELPSYIKEDFIEAGIWARETLTNHEGRGHHFELSADKRGLLMCSFAKPEWPGDHCGRPMETAAEAIIIAVCEYLNGA